MDGKAHLINRSMFQCQWVFCEADIEMESGVQGAYLGVIHVRDKSRIGQESLSLQCTSDKVSGNPVMNFRAKIAH